MNKISVVLVFFALLMSAALNVLGQCNIIYVSPGASGVGTTSDPADLLSAVTMANSGDIIRADTGTYVISNPINIPDGVTFEGGFMRLDNWRKTSLIEATRILRDTNNPEGTIGQDRLVAFYGSGVSNFRFQDIKIATEDADGHSRTTYGVHLTNCSNYTFSRTIIVAGNGSDGADGLDGVDGMPGGNGLNGGAGDNDNESASGPGGNGGGVGGGTAGTGAPNPDGCCSVGGIGENGGVSTIITAGGAGGGGGGGESDRDGGRGGYGGGVVSGFGGNYGNGGDSDGCGGGDCGGIAANGSNGTNGVDGADGLFGAYLLGFFTPGSNGTDGTGGLGGGGGGGGGEGGTGGAGGSGGGGSFGVYLFNNGPNGVFEQSNVMAGIAGAGGAGGLAGIGGAGGDGHWYTGGDVGCGGNGGDGGDGGTGGAGGNGQAGESADLYQDGGTAPATMDIAYALLSQPVITHEDIVCTNEEITFAAVNYSGIWNFYGNAVPSNLIGANATIQFQNTGWLDVQLDGYTYANFMYISPLTISLAQAGTDHNICAGVTTATLSGNVPTEGNGAWISVGSATVDNPTQNNSSVSGLVLGDNEFVWQISSACCSTRDTVNIFVSDSVLPVISCPADQNVYFDADCQFTLPDYTGLTTATDNCSTPTVTQSPVAGTIITNTQTITFTADDGNGNTSQCTFDVIVKDARPPIISCAGNVESCDEFITFNEPTYSDNCSGATIAQTEGLPSGSAFPVGTTTNTYIVTDGAGNTAICSFDIVRYAIPTVDAGPDVTLDPGIPHVIDASVDQAVTYEWYPVAGLDDPSVENPTALPFSTTTYTLTVTNSNGCIASDDITVSVEGDIEINNFMSPNGDGKNDTWEVKGNWLLAGCRVHVFNSWGNTVFESTGYQNQWDGTKNGQPVPKGNYNYIISCDGQKSRSGNILVVR